MGKSAKSGPKQQVGMPIILAAVAGLLVILIVLYLVFMRPSELGGASGITAAPPTSTAPESAGQPNMPVPPPSDTDKEHIGPDTSGTPK